MHGQELKIQNLSINIFFVSISVFHETNVNHFHTFNIYQVLENQSRCVLGTRVGVHVVDLGLDTIAFFSLGARVSTVLAK